MSVPSFSLQLVEIAHDRRRLRARSDQRLSVNILPASKAGDRGGEKKLQLTEEKKKTSSGLMTEHTVRDTVIPAFAVSRA